LQTGDLFPSLELRVTGSRLDAVAQFSNLTVYSVMTPRALLLKIRSAHGNNIYPNSGFVSYWKYLRKTSDLEGDTLFIRVLRGFQTLSRFTLQVLGDAGIELLFLAAFFFIITKMSQGRDLIVSLFEPQGLYSSMRIVYTVLSAMSLSVAMWIVPAFLFQERDRKNRSRRYYRSIFKRHLFFVHRILPLFPFWLLAYALFNGPYIPYVFICLSAFQLIGLFWFNHAVTEEMKDGRRAMFWGSVGVLIFAFTVFCTVLYKRYYLEAKITLAFILYLLSVVMFFIYHEVDRQLLKENRVPDELTQSTLAKYPINSVFYLGALAIHAALLIVLFTSRRSFEVAPESMLLYIFSLYIFLIDLAAYLVNVTALRKATAMLTLLVVLLLYGTPLLNLNVRHYTMDSLVSSSVLNGRERLSFSERFQLLKDSMKAYPDSVPYPIVLIDGDGGGSRAGMWFSENLINFDYYTNGRFRNHIFSMSTVSGSSVGLSTIFTFWDQQQKTGSLDPRWRGLPSRVYANNFVGSSVSGFLLTDVWKSFWPWKVDEDRNSTLQAEESYYTQKACNQLLGDSGEVQADIPRSEQILSKEFLGFFYDTTGGKLAFRAGRPLVFINTCRSNDGRRGILSPMKLDNDVFHDAIDVAGYLYDSSVRDCYGGRLCQPHRGQNITLGQACNTSELFPVFSAPAYIDSLGSFVDGGYHENSGLKTTLDVYAKLKDTLRQDGELMGKRYKIYIVYLKNGSSEKDLYKPLPSKTPLTLPLEALSNQPFQGSQSYFEERTKYVNRTDSLVQYIEVRLDYHRFLSDSANNKRGRIEKQIFADLARSVDTTKKDTVLNFPLARWLSRTVISQMQRSAALQISGASKNDSLVALLNQIIQLKGKNRLNNQFPTEDHGNDSPGDPHRSVNGNEKNGKR
jgi:hypothetical protein